MSDHKQAHGVCSEVSERGEWTTFHIDTGGQYPVKLSTKKAELVELARAASRAGSEMTWTYSESQGNPNPHRPGEFFTNRYLEGVAPRDAISENAEQVDQRVTGPPLGENPRMDGGMTPEKWDAKERRDYRSRAWAQTISAFQHTIKVDEDPVAVFERLQPFQRKVYIDITGMFAFPADESDVPF